MKTFVLLGSVYGTGSYSSQGISIENEDPFIRVDDMTKLNEALQKIYRNYMNLVNELRGAPMTLNEVQGELTDMELKVGDVNDKA